MNDVIKVGEEAIDFKLKDQNGDEVSLKDFEGKKVLLSFHPLAWTAGWLDHMRALELNYDGFIEKNIVPLGINVDQPNSKSAWARVINIKKLKMLSDYNPLGRVAKAYGIFLEKIDASRRANILIDEKGKVEWVELYEISEIPDFKEVLSKISKL